MSENKEYPFTHHQIVYLDGRYMSKEEFEEYEKECATQSLNTSLELTKITTSLSNMKTVMQILIIPIVMLFLTQIIELLKR